MAHSQLEDFSERKPHRNLGLEVDGKTFWVARDGLAEVSSVFNAMFYGKGEFKEKAKDIIQLPNKNADSSVFNTMFYGESEFKEKSQDIVQLKNKNADEILEFLRCLFTYKEIDNENLDTLLKFCDEYDVKYLMENCKKFLVKQIGSAMQMYVSKGWEKIIKLFLTGVQYKIKDIVRGTLPAVARYGLAKLQSSFDQLPIEIQKAVLFQIAGQAIDHERNEQNGTCTSCRYTYVAQCKFCNTSVCKCIVLICNKKSDLYSKRCTTCHDCRKQTIFDTFAKDEIESSGCQCVCTLANLELEKIGL